MIYVNSCRRGTCRSCGKAVTWATSIRTERASPFDELIFEPQIDGLVDPLVATVDLGRSVSHFATCPQASAWRRRRGLAME
jgi:hypothetical protein